MYIEGKGVVLKIEEEEYIKVVVQWLIKTFKWVRLPHRPT